MKNKGFIIFTLIAMILMGLLILKVYRDNNSAMAEQEGNIVSQAPTTGDTTQQPAENPDSEVVTTEEPVVTEPQTDPVEEPNTEEGDVVETPVDTPVETPSETVDTPEDSEVVTEPVEQTDDIKEEPVHSISIDALLLEVGDTVYNFELGTLLTLEKPDSMYVLVNKKNALSPDYVPADLVIPDVFFSFEGYNEKKQMRADAAGELEKLFQAALDAGHTLAAVSGYRSYARQEVIYANNVNNMGEAAANKVSAKPGQSEHQTGLAMDVSCQSVGYDLVQNFGETEEGIWLSEHAHEYGFIIRYKKDKTDITGYSFEPWHIRYVGADLATFLYENDLTLEEFYENY